MTPSVHPYGADPAQFLELTLPPPVQELNGSAVLSEHPVGEAPAPVVVVLHGGFWRARYGIELARPLAADLAARGWAAVAVEYRRVGAGGGWPQTLTDVATAIDLLPDLTDAARLDLADVTVIGHSAGGHLAAWVAGRHQLPAGAPGAGPRVTVSAAVLQAGVLDLDRGHAQRLGAAAVADFLGGGPDAVPERYAAADPVRLLPTGAAVLCVHGTGDDTVPLEQSRRYAAAATAAGDRVEVAAVPGDHMGVIDPASDAWQLTVGWLMGRRTAAPDRTTLGS
ncbi:Alpha/beta hydrolase family protein [Modestobacter sp. DSM 44400]|uniref:alpha/beta hydrolase family protein n=1 Tax=Modestobacter sp. DSM 44400 TaxID=1550230 RepID=UPI00089BFA65|nr:alpha/beta fold hydrolase [Modestobacter sp. DSM 44400]SDY35320.1 Alpha/beta hydrolase family protein [Modestobacter sp. DSM 44400]